MQLNLTSRNNVRRIYGYIWIFFTRVFKEGLSCLIVTSLPERHVLTAGIGPYIYGFTVNSIHCFVLYLMYSYENDVLSFC